MVFNTSKKTYVDCYGDVNFMVLWVHKNPQDTICAERVGIYLW